MNLLAGDVSATISNLYLLAILINRNIDHLSFSDADPLALKSESLGFHDHAHRDLCFPNADSVGVKTY